MNQAVPRSRRNRDVLGPFEEAGEQLLFWWEVVRNVPLTIRHYGKQIGTILAEASASAPESSSSVAVSWASSSCSRR